jgi:hypothetical protein
MSVGAGVASRSYHLVSDPRSEPELSFYDFWLPAGTDTIPVPTVRHVAIQLDGGGASRSWRLGAYASFAKNLMDLRPFEDTTTIPSRQFRRVDARTFGLEAQIASSDPDRRTQYVLIYVLAWSSRRSGARWAPWSFDRRHSVRGLVNGSIGRRWTASLLGDVATGTPFTPVREVYAVGIPDPQQGVTRDPTSQPVYGYGVENSARGGITARADVSFVYHGKGPWKSRMALAFSVVNVFVGPVAPVEANPPGEVQFSHTGITYRHAFLLPPIPTINLQLRW